jgi:DNA replication protein DnaC
MSEIIETGIMLKCEKHGEYPERKYKWVIDNENPFTVLPCPKCQEAALADYNKHEADEAKRNAKTFREEKLRGMNIEPAYHEASFSNFQAVTLELEKNLERVRELIDGKISKIVMTGKNGTGKTHLACAALQIKGGRIQSMYEISTMIRSSYTAKADRSELEIVDDLARLPLLVIDEIGRTKGGDADANWLSYIIDKRHVRGLPLILITNKHVKRDCPEKGCAGCLENYIAEDIMSRLCENGVLLRFTGEDWRKRA